MTKVSIITVCLNAGDTIRETVDSVLGQQDADIEYIVIDGGSVDSTLSILEPYRDRIDHLISEKDDGLYYAMNKGIDIATGDIIGFLNSQDVFTSTMTVQAIASAMDRSDAELFYADIEITYGQGKITRLLRGSGFDPDKLRAVRFPPHPSLYIRGGLLRRAGYFDTRFRVAADVELLLRIMCRFSPNCVYVPETVVRMRGGGISNRGFSSYWQNSRELIEAYKSQGMEPDLVAIYGRGVRRGVEVLDGLWSRRSSDTETDQG